MQLSAATGHSLGEIAAAFTAGYISSAEAIIAAYCRGYVVGKHTMDGAMMTAGMSREAAEEAIAVASVSGKMRVACANSPESVTISGDVPAIDILLEALKPRAFSGCITIIDLKKYLKSSLECQNIAQQVFASGPT